MLIKIEDIKGILYLGVQGETLVKQIDIDCSSWLSTYQTGTLTIEAMRPGDTSIYIADTTTSNNILTWNIKQFDTAQNGQGTFQIKLTTENNIKLTHIMRTLVDDKLTATTTGRLNSLPTMIRDPHFSAEDGPTPRRDRIFKLEDLKNITLLGIQGEKYITTIRIDLTPWMTQYPNGLPTIIAQRPTEDTTYLCDTELDRKTNLLYWYISNYDTGKAGLGTFQLRLDEDDKTKLSQICRTRIYDSQTGTFDPDPPTPRPSWIDEVMDAAERAEQSAKDIEDLTVHGHAIPSASQPTVTKTKEEGKPYHLEFGIPSFAGEAVVYSVNGKTGHVTLDVNDIKVREALMDGTLKVPSRALEVAGDDVFILYGGNATN